MSEKVKKKKFSFPLLYFPKKPKGQTICKYIDIEIGPNRQKRLFYECSKLDS